MAQLELIVGGTLDGEVIALGGALADVTPLGDGGTEAHDVPVPFGTGAPARVKVAPGQYVVQARFPDGSVQTRAVKVSAGDVPRVTFDAINSPHEWLQYQSYSGVVPAGKRTREPAMETAPPATSSLGAQDLQPISPEPGDAPITAGGPEEAVAPVPLDMTGTVRIGEEMGVPALDDIGRVPGIGDKLESALRARGINNILQVAGLTDRDLDWLAQSAKALRPTLGRYDIAGAARVLLDSLLPDLLPLVLEGAGSVAPSVQTETVMLPAQMAERVRSAAGAAQSVETVDALAQLDAAPQPAPLPDAEMWWFERVDDTPIWPALDALLRDRLTPDAPADALAWRLEGTPPDVIGFGSGVDRYDDGPISALVLSPHTPHPLTQRPDSTPRAYGVLHDGLAAWLCPLPLPWRRVSSGGLADLLVTFDRATPSASFVDLMPRDPDVAALLAYLRAGDSRATTALLRTAQDRLYSKVSNPFAAAAGALVLVNALRWSTQRSEDTAALFSGAHWDDWVGNLQAWNPWLPDGAVLHAWLALLEAPGVPDTARDDLLAACQGGLPVYAGVFRLLVDGLRLLRGRAEAADRTDPEVTDALTLLDRAALRIDTRQVFTAIRLTDRRRWTEAT